MVQNLKTYLTIIIAIATIIKMVILINKESKVFLLSLMLRDIIYLNKCQCHTLIISLI